MQSEHLSEGNHTLKQTIAQYKDKCKMLTEELGVQTAANASFKSTVDELEQRLISSQSMVQLDGLRVENDQLRKDNE
jgi:hypothetical protein